MKSCSLSAEIVANIHDALEVNPTQRDFYDYKIVGEIPTNIILEDPFEVSKDRLYNISKVTSDVLQNATTYIDAHYARVYKKCVGVGLLTAVSKGIFSPGCCDVQMHKSCFKQCKKNNVTHCINPFCQQDESGKVYALNWILSFYQEALQKKANLKAKQIRDIDCPVCMEPLKPAVTGVVASAIIANKRQKRNE